MILNHYWLYYLFYCECFSDMELDSSILPGNNCVVLLWWSWMKTCKGIWSETIKYNYKPFSLHLNLQIRVWTYAKSKFIQFGRNAIFAITHWFISVIMLVIDGFMDFVFLSWNNILSSLHFVILQILPFNLLSF